MSVLRRSIQATAALVAFAIAGVAGAQAGRTVSLPSLDIERLRLDPAAAESLVTPTGLLLDEGQTRLGIAAQYAHGTAVTRVGDEYASLRLGARTLAHLTVAHAFTHWLQAGLQVPLILYQNEGDELSQAGFAEVDAAGMGTPLFTLQGGILRQADGMPVNLSVGATVGIPMGDRSALARDPQPTFIASAAVGRDFGQFKLGGQLALRLHSLENFAYRGLSKNETDTVDHELQLGVSATREFLPKLRGELGLLTDVSLKNPGVSVQPFLGGRYQVNPDLEAFVGLGPAFGALVGTPQFRMLGGIAYRGGVK